jgi:hypothetical protein
VAHHPAKPSSARRQYELFDAYEQTLPSRWLVEEYARHLEQLGAPLADEQQEWLLTIVATARRELPSVSAAEAVQNLEGIAGRMGSNLDARIANDRAILEEAESVLSSDQLAGISAYQQAAQARERKSTATADQVIYPHC